MSGLVEQAMAGPVIVGRREVLVRVVEAAVVAVGAVDAVDLPLHKFKILKRPVQ